MKNVENISLRAIHKDEALPLEVFAKVVGLGRHGMRSLRRLGLPVRRVAGRGYVLGADFLDLLATLGDAATQPEDSEQK